MRQIERKYLQGNRTELPKTVGGTTLFVREILEKSGQGETYVFDPALLVYLLPTAQEEEETKREPDEERARDYVLREKETMKLITREEKSREFFTNIIRESTLPGAVEMLWQKSWKEQLSGQLQILLREYRELEQRQQVFFDSREMPQIQEEKYDAGEDAGLIAHMDAAVSGQKKLYQAKQQKRYQALQEFQKELAVLEQQVEIWKQETGTNAKEERLRRRLEEQVERLFVCRQILEEQEEERLNEVILKVLEEQPEFVQAAEQPAQPVEHLVQTEEQPVQPTELSVQTVELLHRIRRDVLEQAGQLKEGFVAQIQTRAQGENQIVELIRRKIQELTQEEATEIKRELLYKISADERTLLLQREMSTGESTLSLLHEQPLVEEWLNEVILKVLEEQPVQTVEHLMQTEGQPVQNMELLHRIHKDVLEQAGQLKEDSAAQIQTRAQGENQIVELIRRKIQELTQEEATEIRRELLYKMSEETGTLSLQREIPAGESALSLQREMPANADAPLLLHEQPLAERWLNEVILKVLEEQPAQPVEHLVQTEEQPAQPVKHLLQTTEQPMHPTELSLQPMELLHRIHKDVLEQAGQLKGDSAAQIQTRAQGESQIVELIRRKIQELTQEEATEIRKELLYKMSEETGTLSLQREIPAGESALSLQREMPANADAPLLLHEQPLAEKWLNEVILKVLEEQPVFKRTAEQPVQSAEQLLQTEVQNESQIVKLIRRKIQELTQEEATEIRRELLYKMSEETGTLSLQREMPAGESALSLQRELSANADVSLLLHEQSLAEKWLNEVILKVLEEQPVFKRTTEQPVQSAEQLMQTKEQLLQTKEQSLQPMELLHRIHRDVLEQAGQLKGGSAAQIQTEVQNESQIVKLIRRTMQGLTKEEAAEIRRELLHKRSYGQSKSEPEDIRADVRRERENGQKEFLIEQTHTKEKELQVVQTHAEELLYQIRERCMEKMVREVRKEEENLVSVEEKLQIPQFIYKIIQEILGPEQREQLHTEEMERLYKEKGEQVRQIFTQENRLEQLIYQNAEKTGEPQVFRVLRLLHGWEMPARESMLKEQAEAPQQTLTEVNLGASETEDTLSWQQLAARPEIRELIENREIRVPGEQRGAEGQLKYYQNHVEKVEQLREEQQEQFKNLMERAALQEEQIIRIENWQQEIKERLREQEERQTVPERDEQVFKKFQEQLRMERLRRGLI